MIGWSNRQVPVIVTLLTCEPRAGTSVAVQFADSPGLSWWTAGPSWPQLEIDSGGWGVGTACVSNTEPVLRTVTVAGTGTPAGRFVAD